jgi:tRNA dimethylallyltransferase
MPVLSSLTEMTANPLPVGAGKARSRVGFIVGPTASGKTSLALEIAERLGAEIVNADSRQVYRGMDLGTAKPTAEERRRVPHHLIDVREPDKSLDVAEFARLARAAIAGIAERGRPALVVGGSGLYLRAIRGGIFDAPHPSSEIRARLLSAANQDGVERLFAQLKVVDPAAATRIGACDFQRIARALEIYEQTGIPISEHQRRHRFAQCTFESLTVGVSLGREELYQTIERRFDAMLAGGLLEELRGLLAKGYDPGKPPLCTIGYRELAAAEHGELELADAICRAKRASRRLAKRQLTWFRADPEIVWLEVKDATGEALRLFEEFFGSEERT